MYSLFANVWLTSQLQVFTHQSSISAVMPLRKASTRIWHFIREICTLQLGWMLEPFADISKRLSLLNATSIIGRIVPNLFANKIGGFE